MTRFAVMHKVLLGLRRIHVNAKTVLVRLELCSVESEVPVISLNASHALGRTAMDAIKTHNPARFWEEVPRQCALILANVSVKIAYSPHPRILVHL
jgi:hypothetical protein